MALTREVFITKMRLGVVRTEMVVRGPQGCIQFYWRTQDAYDGTFTADYGEVMYHSLHPTYDGQEIMVGGPNEEPCHLLKGPCFCDGSCLEGEEMFRLLFTSGEDYVWRALEERYRTTFVEGR